MQINDSLTELHYVNDNDEFHRLDGAALEIFYPDVEEFCASYYFINGKQYKFSDYLKEIQNNYHEYFPIVFSKYINNNYDDFDFTEKQAELGVFV